MKTKNSLIDFLVSGWKDMLSLQCGECGTKYERGADARVDANMKCGACAYSGEPRMNEDAEDYGESEIGACVEAPEVKHIPY